MNDLAGRAVLVTGAASGIGLCTAEEFARAHAKLILTDIKEDALEQAAARVRGAGAESVDTYVVDVSKKDQVDAMAAEVLARHGGLDVLVNNAGIGHNGELASTTLETWRRLVDINIWGVLHHVYAFLPSMIERHSGQIVNVSSGQTFFRMPTWGAYAATKVAVAVFSEILHFEVARHNVKVTTVYPYLVNTGFYSGVEPATFVGRLSMKLLPYYSDSPERVGKIIVNAVRKGKRVEMVNLFNDLGYFSHLVPPLAGVVSKATVWLLGGDGQQHAGH